MGIRNAHIQCSESTVVSYYPLPRGKDISSPKRVKFLSLKYVK